MTERPPFSHPLRVADIPPDGRTVAIESNGTQRQSLARLLDIPGISSLRAEFDISADRRGRVAVRGRVHAEVTRICVVTLEEIPETIDEQVATVFFPGLESETDEIVVDPQRDDLEPYEGGIIDLGVLAAEHLALGLDPYPRRPDVAFEGREEMSDAEASPFAALSALRPGGRKKG